MFRRLISFSIRDLFWLTLVVGLGTGCWVNYCRMRLAEKQTNLLKLDLYRTETYVEELEVILKEDGYIFSKWEPRDKPIR